MEKYTEPTYYFDFEHHAIQDFVKETIQGIKPEKEKAIAIYKAVRDGWRYKADSIFVSKEAYKISSIFYRETGHCLDKAILMVGCLREANIPARMCLAKVKNHIAAEEMIEILGTDELTPHGYVEVFLNGKWVKATPTFNKSLCEWLNVSTLEFDGENDSVFQEFDKEGGLFMEYLEEYGNFADVPFEYIFQIFKQHYPKFYKTNC